MIMFVLAWLHLLSSGSFAWALAHISFLLSCIIGTDSASVWIRHDTHFP
jgi:hypothetical protein